jgi:RimJ/RimL family protein N-acetyltransferase
MLPAELATERLTLRPWRTDDVDAFHTIWGDPRVIFWGPSKDRDASAVLLRSIVEHHGARGPGLGWWAVLERGEIVGNMLLKPAVFAEGMEIGWHVAHAAQRRGIATEAARRVLLHAHELGHRRVVAAILVDNAASQGVARNLGMTYERDVMHADLLHGLWSIEAV